MATVEIEILRATAFETAGGEVTPSDTRLTVTAAVLDPVEKTPAVQTQFHYSVADIADRTADGTTVEAMVDTDVRAWGQEQAAKLDGLGDFSKLPGKKYIVST